MKITLLGDASIRLEPVAGPLTIEAPTADVAYSPFHMLASGLATCTFSVLYSWATHAKIPVDDLVLDVSWTFGEEPHRVDALDVSYTWPSLPPERTAAATRVAELCTVHATLMHPPRITIAARGAAGAVAAEPPHAPASAQMPAPTQTPAQPHVPDAMGTP